MELKPGSRWKSAVCDTEVVVVRPPKGEADLRCGGHPLVPNAEPKPEGATISADLAGGSQMGKRYADEATGMELLCTKPGAGTLSIGDQPIVVKEAKKLPASD
jgi:hypothetical protein